MLFFTSQEVICLTVQCDYTLERSVCSFRIMGHNPEKMKNQVLFGKSQSLSVLMNDPSSSLLGWTIVTQGRGRFDDIVCILSL